MWWFKSMWAKYGIFCIAGIATLTLSLVGYIAWFIRYIQKRLQRGQEHSMGWFNSMWVKYRGLCILGIMTLTLSLFGYIAWFIHYIQSLVNAPGVQQSSLLVISPISLAAVTGTLGGLVLIGAFYKGKNGFLTPSDREHSSDLKIVGKSLLIASACFIIGFFFIEYVRLITSPVLSWSELFYVIATDVVMMVAGLFTCFALSLLVTIVKSI